MGILNVTPDSFSDGGTYDSLEAAVEQGRRMEREGADMIDVGGESTRPGHTPVSAAEEKERVIPVLRALRRQTSLPISVDTSKAEVAEAALGEGADMINDVWGFRRDPRMAEVVAAGDAACCLMHNKERAEYTDLCGEIEAGLQESLRRALEAGVKPEKIILDPGFGFGKTPEHNLVLLRNLARFRDLGYPLLIGVSRKSVIGKILDLPVEERLEGTLATTVIGVAAGMDVLRVHDVQANKRAAVLADAVYRTQEDRVPLS
jgi:dihydropteroate synthase